MWRDDEYGDERSQRGIQENNGSPMGLGQPNKGGVDYQPWNAQNNPQDGRFQQWTLPPQSFDVATGNIGPHQTEVLGNGQTGILTPGPAQAQQAAKPPSGQQGSQQGSTNRNYPQGVPQRGGVGTLTGYPDVLGRSMKHVFGGIASRYGNDRNNLDAIMRDPEFLQWFPNARRVKDDTIDFGGQLSDFETGVPVNLVDVFRGGDDAIQWIDQNYVNDGAQGGMGMGGVQSDPLPANSLYSSIQNQIFGGSQSQGDGSQNQQDMQSTFFQLLQQLLGGNMQTPNVRDFVGGNGQGGQF